jgi:radical SAM superfamily enzyme YgiQ (UPF0313 family)
MMPHFEIGPIRPPSEGGGNSLLVRFTRNCPWSRCRFCAGSLYDQAKFELRSIDEIKKDIDAVKKIADNIKSVSWQAGRGGKVDEVVGTAIVRSRPELQSDHCFVTVFNWMYSGAQTAFIQDADSLIMRTPDLKEAITYLKTTFPTLERITSYARAKTIYRKTPEEMQQLKSCGLDRLHVGLETGDDELLKIVDKGITAEQHIAAGKKVMAAGMELSLYIMPDLGGRKYSEQHARNTARVLNAINPNYIRSRPFIPRPPTPMFDDYEAGIFQVSSPHERLRELKTLVEGLEITSHLCFDHLGNSWNGENGRPLFRRDYEGYKFPEEKQLVLDLIEEGLQLDESRHTHVRVLMGLSRL